MINNNMSDEEILAIVKDIEMEDVGRRREVSEEPQPQPINLQVLTDDSGEYHLEEALLQYTDDESGLGGAVINRELRRGSVYPADL